MTTEDDFVRMIHDEPDDAHTRGVFADWLDEHGNDPVRAAMFRNGVVKRFGVDFRSDGGALTLYRGEVCDIEGVDAGFHTRTHDSGWTISGEIHEDYYVWVNDFVATHPTFGRVEGNFESLVFASSEESFQDFYHKHPPSPWDYGDI